MSVTTFTVAFPDELVQDAKEAAETIGIRLGRGQMSSRVHSKTTTQLPAS